MPTIAICIFHAVTVCQKLLISLSIDALWTSGMESYVTRNSMFVIKVLKSLELRCWFTAVRHHVKSELLLFQVHGVPFFVCLAAQFTNLLLH